MDWIKVKTKHVFHDGFNKTTLWAWVRLMALVAEIESMPTERQILAIITKHELELLSNHFKSESKLLSNVLEKVLEDVERLKSERKRLKQYRAQVSEKDENRTSTVQRTERDKIREEEIRGEKSNINTSGDKPQKEKSEHVLFLENWSDLYSSMVGHPYKIDWKKDSSLVTGLIKSFGYETVLKKAKLLFSACQNKSFWFTKDGIADFTIGKLSSQWNGIIEKSKPGDDWVKKKEEELKNVRTK